MRADFIDTMERIFFEKNFEYSDSKETVQKNLEKANLLVETYGKKAAQLAEDVEDGIAFDESDAILTVQSYALAVRFKERFESETGRACARASY